jgi:hypothetical protein
MTDFYVAEYRTNNRISGYDVRRVGTGESFAYFAVSDWGTIAARDGAARLRALLLTAKLPDADETPMFTRDNTEGFSAAELAVLNDRYHRVLRLALCDLPGGAEGTSDDLLAQIRQGVAETVLANYVPVEEAS